VWNTTNLENFFNYCEPGLCLNFPENYLTRVLVGTAFALFFYICQPNNLLYFLFLICLWTSGLGTSPFSVTDYLDGYLNNLHFYNESWTGKTGAPSNAVAGIRQIEGVGWRIFYFIRQFFGDSYGLQAACGLIQLASYFAFLTSLKVPSREKRLGLVLLMLSGPYVLATDWYLRQGVSWAMVLCAIAVLQSSSNLGMTIPFFCLFSGLAMIFHLSSIAYLGSFLSALLLVTTFRQYKILPKMSPIVIGVCAGFLCVVIIFPFRAGLIDTFDLLYNLAPSFSYVSLYSGSGWSGTGPGTAIGIFVILTSLSYWLNRGPQATAIEKSVPLMLFATIFFAVVGMMTSSIASRLLFPFLIVWLAMILAGTRQLSGATRSTAALFLCAVIISHSILIVVIENGGTKRPEKKSESRRWLTTMLQGH
jgi:hypothetical protein